VTCLCVRVKAHVCVMACLFVHVDALVVSTPLRAYGRGCVRACERDCLCVEGVCVVQVAALLFRSPPEFEEALALCELDPTVAESRIQQVRARFGYDLFAVVSGARCACACVAARSPWSRVAAVAPAARADAAADVRSTASSSTPTAPRAHVRAGVPRECA
jgi:hypothetical protein